VLNRIEKIDSFWKIESEYFFLNRNALATTSHHTIWTDDLLTTGPDVVGISGKISTREMKIPTLLKAGVSFHFLSFAEAFAKS